jgi:hypothetical protein
VWEREGWLDILGRHIIGQRNKKKWQEHCEGGPLSLPRIHGRVTAGFASSAAGCARWEQKIRSHYRAEMI